MTWKVNGTTYTFYNSQGQAIFKTDNFDQAMKLIRDGNMERRND
jgi:hypothetical protein